MEVFYLQVHFLGGQLIFHQRVNFLLPNIGMVTEKKKQDPIKLKSSFLKYIEVRKDHYLTQIRNESNFYKILPFK